MKFIQRLTESCRRAMGGKSSRPLVRSEPEKKPGKVTLEIAITGVSGAGKSSLVNALRVVSDFDEAAALTDVMDEESLHRVAKVFGKDYGVLTSAIKKSPMSIEITPQFVSGLLARFMLWVNLTALSLVVDFIPVLGSLFERLSSFITTFYTLTRFLNDMVEDAENVWRKATEPGLSRCPAPKTQNTN